jgi:cytoskeletal protein CcmA (bactofilin family)
VAARKGFVYISRMSESQAPQPKPTVPVTQPNVLLADVEVKGTIIFEQSLVSHGKIEGEIMTPGNFTVGKSGSVQGDVQAGSVAIHGTINGNVTVNDRCELKSNAQLIGDLEAPRLTMEEGATFVGRANVTPTAQPNLAIPNRSARRT